MEDRDYLDPGVIARLEQTGAGFPRKLITLFLEQTPRRLDSARAGSRAGDWKVVEEAAHSLKSSAGNLGATRLRELADRMEAIAARGRSTGRVAGLDTLLADLDTAYTRTRDLLIAIKDRKAL